MTDVAHIDETTRRVAHDRDDTATFWLSETFWGYIIKSRAKASALLLISQAFSMLLAAGMIVIALGLWLSPTAFASAPDMLFRAAGSFGLIFSATLMLWHASRGTQSELQVDQHLAEVREVIHNRAGRETLIGRHGFDAIASIDVQASPKGGSSRLCITFRDGSATLLVAEGQRAALESLGDRMAGDMMIAGRTSAA